MEGVCKMKEWIFALINIVLLLYLIFKSLVNPLVIALIKGKRQKDLQDRAHKQKRAIQDIEYKYTLSRTDLKRRLEVHQEAYVLWWELQGALGVKEDVRKMVFKCQDWYVGHCLYLTPKASEAFSKAYHDAFTYQMFLDSGRKEQDEMEKLLATIRQLGTLIRQEVSFLSPQPGELLKKSEEEKKG